MANRDYSITGPDGRTLSINGPDNATPEQLRAAAERAFAASGEPAEESFPQQIGRQVLNAGAGAIRGAGSIGATILAPVDILKDMVAGKSLSLESNRERRQAMTDALGSMGADTESLAFQGGKLGAEIAGTLGAGGAVANTVTRVAPKAAAAVPNLMSAVRTSGMIGGNAITRATGGAVAGGASAGLVNPEDAGVGVVAGGALPVVTKAAGAAGNAIGRAVRGGSGASPEVSALAARAKALGIDIPADRLADSKPLNAVASALNYVPFSGRAATEARMEQQLNRAASRLIGQNTPNMNKALDDASKALGGEFDRVLQGNTVQMTPTFRQALADAENRATAELVPGEAALILRQIAEIQTKGASGAIDGQTAYNIKKTLDRIGKRNSNEAFYAGDLKRDLMAALNDSLGPAEAAAFAKTRQQYSNMLTLEKLAKNGAEGEISVARLANLRNINNDPLQELADIAAQFVKPREGQHGAAQRAAAGGITFGLAGAPGLAAGAATGRAANMTLNSNAMRSFVLNDGAANPLVRAAGARQLGYRATPLTLGDR